MTRSIALFLFLVSALTACAPRSPILPYPKVDPAPLVRALDEQRQRFTSLRSLATIETERKGKRRVYEDVAIVQRGFERLRVEGYGPLGQTLFTVLWNGADLLVLPPDGSGPRTLGPNGLERIIGVALTPEDLCAVLVGASPRVPDDAVFAAGCSSDGRCAVDLPVDGDRWRVHVRRRNPDGEVEIDAIERYHGAKLLFLVTDEDRTEGTGYALPRRIIVRDPVRSSSMTVEYQDAEIGGRLSDDLFEPVRPE